MSESSNLPRLVHSDGRETILIGRLTIGRSSECSLQMEDDRVSRQHARVEVIGQRIMLSDLGSHNGTWVNDQKITAPAELYEGDHIRIGRTIFTFKAAIIPPQDEPAQPPVILKKGGKTMSWLTTEPMTLVRGNDGAEFGLNRSMRIGRDETNELALKADTSASQFHAMIELPGGQVIISDLNSSNGTWVNGKRITAPTVLKHGDKLRLGDTVFRLRVGDRSLPPLDVEASPSKAGRLGCGLLSVGGFAIVIVLMIGLLIAWPVIFPPTATPISNTAVVAVGVTQTTQTAVVDVEATQAAARKEAERAVVLIITLIDNGQITGSGSLLNQEGYLLTNFHMIGYASSDEETAKNDGKEKGDWYSKDEWVLVGLNRTNPEYEPDTFYRCEVIAEDPDLDLAILRVSEHTNINILKVKRVSDSDFHSESSKDLDFHSIRIGNSDDLEISDPITIIGFPGVGGNTLTLFGDKVAGFSPDELLGYERGWIKTGPVINSGNSGGMALNDKGELIGIPTANMIDPENMDKLGLIRPINLARDIIKSACPECLP